MDPDFEPTHWLYTFGLYTCRLSNRVRVTVNPFTNKKEEFPIDDGLNAVDREAVRKVFEKFGVKGPEEYGEGCAVYLPSSESVRFRGGPFEDSDARATGFEVEITVLKLSENVLNLVMQVARQGNLALMSSTGESVRLTQKSTDPIVQKRWPKAGVLETAGDLQTWLDKEITARRVHVRK